MHDPLSPSWRIVVWPLTALAFVGAAVLVRQWSLTTSVAPLGLLDLEFASTQARVNQIVAAWDFKQARSDAICISYLDFLFIILYSSS